ncbi:MAG TPA: acyltransferase [Chryseolinea sp.]|nr:acyltransferase [Chryseolinea sp.]
MKNVFELDVNPNRTYGLDILRAAAILFVVLEHSGNLLPPVANRITNLFVFDGVSIFFVLSGFLIGGILLRELHGPIDKYSLLDFWMRRWLRTLPSYFLILLLLLAIQYFMGDEANLGLVWRYVLFSQNLISPHPAFFPEAWSLSVEEWFYLIIPSTVFLLIYAFKLTPRKAMIWVAITVLVSVTYFRYQRFEWIVIAAEGDWDVLFRKQVFTRLDSLMYGVIAAHLKHYHQGIWMKHKVKLLIAGVAIFMVNKFVVPQFASFNSLYNCVFSFSIVSIGAVALLPFLDSVKQGAGAVYKGVTYISLVSYSMYLINLSLVQVLIIGKIPWSDIFSSRYVSVLCSFSLFWLLVIALSILMYKYFELPVIRLRDKLRIRDSMLMREGSSSKA